MNDNVKNLTPSENFKKLAEKRVNRTILSLKLIGNLSNKRVYDWNEEQVNKIFNTLQQVLDDNKAKFKIAVSDNEEREFKL
tara:strand:- start:23 stop:265 length:243 start_codon:yes stop_codon:yes gene_type:complete